jgi:hypothetical protein
MAARGSKEAKMPVVLFNCPKTKLPVPTGDKFDLLAWKSLRAEVRTKFECPICRETHIWTKETAYLAGSKPQAK